jgi:hypothetical protein
LRERDAGPFAKPSTVRCEGFRDTGVEKCRYTLLVELYEEAAVAMVAGGEEVAVEAKAREPHHRAAGHSRLSQ